MPSRILLLFAAMMFLRVGPADACSCPPAAPPCEHYWQADAIFRGRVEAIDPELAASQDPFPGKLVRFAVLERFVGADGPQVTVWTASSGAACGYRFALNREYVVYAYKRKEGRLTTGTCSRTAPVERAAADLEFARNIAKGGRPLGLVEVVVDLITRPESFWSQADTRARPLPGVPITLRRGEEAFSATTDRAGRFAVSGLAPGTYQPLIDPPPGTRLIGLLPESMTLADTRGCATLRVGLEPDGRILGRVVDGAGRAVRGLTVGLRLPQSANHGLAQTTRFQAITDADGHYEFEGVTPGRFLLAAESLGSSRVLFPGGAAEAKAEPVELRLGGRLTMKDFRLQDVVTITGVAVDTGRAPIEGARVYLGDPADGGGIVTLPVVTDWSGRFVISVPGGQEYVIFAERDRPGATLRTDASEPIRIGPGSPDQPLLLTLRPRY